MNDSSTTENERFLGKPEVCNRFGVDPATIARKVRDGLFPAPGYIFGRARWRLADIQAWEARNVGATPPARARNLRNAKVAT